jgi:hypothetical protein
MDMGQSQDFGKGWPLSTHGAPYTALISQPASSYGDKFQDHLLEQYKLYVESAQTITERRLHSANFFLAINSSLVAVFGITLSSFGNHRWNGVIPLTGILVSIVWFRVVKSYKDLNTAKFKVIHELESYLPAALFKHEWQVCGWGSDPKKYRPLTHSEQYVPLAFVVFYVVLALYAFIAQPIAVKP